MPPSDVAIRWNDFGAAYGRYNMSREYDPRVESYITKVNGIPKLELATELDLASRWKLHADEAARDALVESQLRYVVVIALGYRHYGLPLSELIAEGNFGLIHALKKFEPERGYRLLTYAAHWIRAYIINSIIRSWSLVGGGSGALRSKMFFKLRRERARIMNLLGDGERADQVLAQKLNLPREKLNTMLHRLEQRDVRLDAGVFDGWSLKLVDTLQASEPSQEEMAASAQTAGRTRDAVRSALAALDERERFIVEKRLMADSEDELSLTDIGKRFGISRERVRQLESRAKHKLRTRIRQLELESGRDFLDLGSAA